MRLEVKVGTIASLNAITPPSKKSVLVAAVGQLSQKILAPGLTCSSQPNEWDVAEKIGNVQPILERCSLPQAFRRRLFNRFNHWTVRISRRQVSNAYFQVLKATVSA
jgi:hypothetical protein